MSGGRTRVDGAAQWFPAAYRVAMVNPAAHGGVSHFSKDGASNDKAWAIFVCGYCGAQTAGAVVASVPEGIIERPAVKWVRCTSCHKGSVITEDGLVYPPPLSGEDVDGLPADVADAFGEARRCFSVGAYTACDLMCRKILMHVAVEKGDAEGKKFAEYLTFLEGQGHITASMKTWVDLIRQNANKATHKLPPSDRARAEGTLAFTTQMLRIIYEMDHRAQQFMPPPPPQP